MPCEPVAPRPINPPPSVGNFALGFVLAIGLVGLVLAALAIFFFGGGLAIVLRHDIRWTL